MMHRAWSSTVEVPYCFSRSYVKFQGHPALKIVEFDPNWAFPDCSLQFEFTNGYEMLHKAWNSKGEMLYCFPRSSIKFQGHTVQNITDFNPNWAFPDYRPVAAFKSLRFALFELIHQISRSHGLKNEKIDDLNPNWVRLLGWSQLTNPSHLPCCCMKIILFWYPFHLDTNALPSLSKLCTVKSLI